MAFVAAVCPQCAGNLQVPDDRDVVKCMYCGVDVVVRQAIRLVHGNTGNLLELAEAARAAGNHTEAIEYYNKVLENDPKNATAWFGKGTSSGWLSTLAAFRFQEMFVALENAIRYADTSSAETVRKNAARTINGVAIACYELARKHALEFIALPNTWAEYLPRCQIIVSALKVAHAYHPDDQTIIGNIIHLCKDNIEGVAYNDPYDNNLRKAVHLSDSYEAELRGLMAEYAEKLKRLDPAYQAPEANRPSAGCFVVTARYGDPNHQHVRLLRAFRDAALQRSFLGRAFCRFYYRYGPLFAAVVVLSPLSRALSHRVVVLPGVILARAYFRRAARHKRGDA